MTATTRATPPLEGTSFDEVAFAELKAEVRQYAEGPGEEWAQRIEREREVPPALWDELRELGYLRLAAPRECGGRGVQYSRYLELLELLSMCHASMRMIVHISNGIWLPIHARATQEQRRRFLLPLVRGDIRVAFAMTEPGVGTGTDLRCSVARDGDHYVLNGEKHMITFGTIADYLLCFARVEGSSGTGGTVALMVPPHADGVEARRMPDTMGVRGTNYGHLIFRGARVPVENRLGEEGQGLEVAVSDFLAPSRIGVAISCVGLAQRAIDLALGYALGRVTFGKPIVERQAVAFRLADAATDIEAARQLAYAAARKWERQGGAVADASMAKLFATSMLQRVTDTALQLHGGSGCWSTSPIERVYRDARAQLFEEGTNEVQKTTIARELVRSSPARR